MTSEILDGRNKDLIVLPHRMRSMLLQLGLGEVPEGSEALVSDK